MSLMQPLKVTVVPVTPIQQNCSIVACTATNRAVIVDPGGDVPNIRKAIDEMKVTPERIWLTHGHFDHAGGAAQLAEELSIPIEGPDERDAFLLSDLEKSGERFGIMDARNCQAGPLAGRGRDGERRRPDVQRAACAGSLAGAAVVFVNVPSRFALVGDTLFQNSVGRTDFAYGNSEQLITGIKTKLLPLGDDVMILPGHGPATTIGRERQGNGYLQG